MKPLAYRLRPTCLADIFGQDHLIGPEKILSTMVDKKQLMSLIFYGAPGIGKTTLAQVLAQQCGRPYRFFNAVTGNKKDLTAIFYEAKISSNLVVIIDEIHRLNKDKQDLLLPYIEDGSITVLGATTANPLFSINPAIRSRLLLLEVKRLSNNDLANLIKHLLNKTELQDLQVEEAALSKICQIANGDVRMALNILELCSISTKVITEQVVINLNLLNNTFSDASDDGHYDLLSAFQKSIRGSDVQAALYYLAQLIKCDDLTSISRRLLTTAYEDIGLGNPAACARCLAAVQTAEQLGFPEGRIPLANAVIDLCLSPKSKSAENAIDQALACLAKQVFPMPDYLKYNYLNIKEEEKYDYQNAQLWPMIQYLPHALETSKFYQPTCSGSYEKQLAQNLAKLAQIPRSRDLKELKKRYSKAKI